MWHCGEHQTNFINGGYCPICKLMNGRKFTSDEVSKYRAETRSLDEIVWLIHRHGVEHPNRIVTFIAADLSSPYQPDFMELQIYYTQSDINDLKRKIDGVIICPYCGSLNMRVLNCVDCGCSIV